MEDLAEVQGLNDVVLNMKKVMLEILFEFKQKDDQNNSNSQSRIEKVKVKSQLVLKAPMEVQEQKPVDVLANL